MRSGVSTAIGTGSGDLVGLLAHPVFFPSFDEEILVARRVANADLCSAGVGVAKAFFGVRLNQLSGFSSFFKQLRVSSLGLVPLRVLPELGSHRHLGALGLVKTVLEDV